MVTSAKKYVKNLKEQMVSTGLTPSVSKPGSLATARNIYEESLSPISKPKGQ